MLQDELLHIFRSWWFDPMVASLSFVGFIHLYWFYELKSGLTKYTNYVQWNVGFFLTPHTQSALAYWIGILLLRAIGGPPAPIPDGLPDTATGFLYLMAEVVFGIVAYDFIFFFLHWAMHEIPQLRFLHAKHHDTAGKRLLECNDVLRHSLLDGLLQVLVNISVQRFTPWGVAKSRCARALHNVLVIWMLTESHTTSPEPDIWRKWFVGVREHVHHHTSRADSATLKYQQFFGYLDALRLKYSVQRQQGRKSSKGS